MLIDVAIQVTSVTPPYGKGDLKWIQVTLLFADILDLSTGGWPKFTDQGLNDNYLPVWLSNAGINTYYVGKFMNGFSKGNLATPEPPKGWTNSR